MGKRKKGFSFFKTVGRATQLSPEEKFRQLLKDQNYLQAIELLNKTQKTHPELDFGVTAVELLLAQTQQALRQGQAQQAEIHARQALRLEAEAQSYSGTAHYWVAKSLLEQDRPREALAFIQAAFEDQTLPKTHAGCYLKLLLILGEGQTVQTLMAEQSKRFYATQLHWVRGILALQARKPAEALTHFRKVKDPATPGDLSKAWQVYAQQLQGEWYTAWELMRSLAKEHSSRPLDQPTLENHPLLSWLQLNNRVHRHEKAGFWFDLGEQNKQNQSLPLALLDFVKVLESGNAHDAAHLFLEAKPDPETYPEIKSLVRPLFLRAGEQALDDDRPDCAIEFWREMAQETPLDVSLNVNLFHAATLDDDDETALATLKRLAQWLDQEAPKHPQDWPEQRRIQARVGLHCRTADLYISLRNPPAAINQELSKAERLDPNHPELKVRQGLRAYLQDQNEKAIASLTAGLAGGSTYAEGYGVLLELLEQKGDKAAHKEARRRFGKRFGDLDVDSEVEIDRWIEALATQNYPIFEGLVDGGDHPKHPAQVAERLFVDAVVGRPSKSGKVDVDLEQVAALWDKHLAQVGATPEQPLVLQAIALCLMLFSKRQKGRDGLLKQYLDQLLALEGEQPEALSIYLSLLAVKNTTPTQIRPGISRLLKRAATPGNTLAQVQLHARWFAQTNALMPFLDEALAKEPQNPMLLLAKATTYKLHSDAYESYKEQGFEIARRLQDAAALQAFREEHAFAENQQTAALMPDFSQLNPFDPRSLDRMLEAMIRNMLPNVSQRELDQMLPLLKQQFLNEADMPPGFAALFGDDEDEEDDLPFNFFGPPPRARRSAKNKRKKR